MKITIAFLEEEYKEMKIIRSFLTHYLPDFRVHNNFEETPYMHCYLTTKRHAKAEESEVSDS